MSKQEHALHSKSVDALIEDELQHILIPACELGIERYREFRAANPTWRPRSYGQMGGHNGDGSTKMCEGCRECASTSKSIHIKPQLTVECSGLSKAARPISISFSKPIQHTRVPVAEIAASCQALQNLCVNKASQHHGSKAGAAEETAASKPPLVLPTGREVHKAEETELTTKPKTGEEYAELADSGRIKLSEHAVVHAALSEQATSSEDLSDDTMTPPHMEATSFSDHAAGVSQGDSTAVAKASSKYSNDALTRMEEPILVDNQGLFDFVVATRKIPYGHSFSNLDLTMQKKLHDYFKISCPPCPHCNCNTFVKFRYFNNSGKSSLLQPRYTCRNPDTCLTVQEKSGKAGSRDFTLPRPREADTHKGLPGVANHQRVNGMQGRAIRQPQMIPRVGSKRSVHDLGSPSEAGERSAKLPNTTLSLQTLNGPVPVVDMANLQIVESSKPRSLPFVKPAEDSNSSSSTRTASDEQTGINVRYRAEASSENGLVVVKQPISVHTVASTPGNAEAGTVDRVSKGGKIAEVNICMYIDLSAATSC